MRNRLMTAIILILFVLVGWLSAPALAAVAPPPETVTVSLGNTANELKFFPAQLNFRALRAYQLRLTNPSTLKHYFSAPDFAAAVWTRKVDTGGVEVKGTVREIEIRPGASADWVFVPVRTGEYGLRCTVPGHTEAGMVGTIRVS